MSFFKKVINVFKREQFDWDELEHTLISSDLGVKLTMQILDQLQEKGRKLKAEDVIETCRKEILTILPEEQPSMEIFEDKPTVILVVGVNGVGKTTSTAKLAHYFQSRDLGVTLAAADTFRAAAIEQLEVWSDRLKIPLVKGQYKADPSSVCYNAYDAAVKSGSKFLICDTAGRLHTRHNLMEELKKVERVLAKKDPDAPSERWLVVDATTGSNALNQAQEFNKIMDLTGLIVTKLDGSGKGGCVISIQHELGIPTRFIGTGEAAEDFRSFRAGEFVDEIL
ncbi:MAG: signal recognition particle-docking protein FtsY [Verrucomicrobiota bacterium]